MADETARSPLGMERQIQIYMAGVGGDRPEQPVSIDDLRLLAKHELTPQAFDYLDGAAGSEDTM